jgi:hypothetical protein
MLRALAGLAARARARDAAELYSRVFTTGAAFTAVTAENGAQEAQLVRLLLWSRYAHRFEERTEC